MIFMPNEIVQIPPAVNNYDEYNNKNYAAVLYLLLHQFGFKFEQLYSEELDAVLNLLVDQNKRIIVYDQDGKYHLGKKHTGYNAEVFENVNGCVILK
ncbi:hypothetical protein [Clostridium butyricum]|uniref:Uncharacterized protein n=2 Tax=Clostridium butyricum TaxID=1492 RepID=C4IET8_CLOBU|nr:hypothetical protein [Clostridium butyricum]EDT74391.1 conserved hypothetical protein [Clostridium butyricum 5521]EEP55586.1 conserved hypothetical protein [Clostridium butyricum E4 str. BoNT E BL5262]NFL29702.1 hypothetical protein [Clostridium butyricum]NFS16793.1 hypothetical protein [Clostridium butyricum]